MTTKRGKAVRWAAFLGVAAVVVVAAGWWAFDAWADRRLSEATAWLDEETTEAGGETSSAGEGTGSALTGLRSATPDLRWTERENELLDRLEAAEGRPWSPAELAAARELVGPRRAEADRLGELVRTGGASAAAGSGTAARGAGEDAGGANTYAGDVPLLRASRLLAVDARVALAEGDVERAVERVEDLGALVRAFEGAPGMVRQMFAAAVEGGQLRAVADLVASPAVGRGHLERLRAAFSDLDTETALRRMMRAEAEEALAAMEQLPSDGPADGTLVKLAAAEIVSAYRELATTPFAAVRERHDRRIAAAESPDSPADVVVGLAIPNMVEGVLKIQAAGSARQLARLALALRLHALDEGAYPATLDALLVPAGPDSLAGPDPLAGQPPRWQVGPGGAVLSNPAAEALWRGAERRSDPPFVWRLPA